MKTISQEINQFMNRILYLAQSSLSEHQYEAFRKLALDYGQECKRKLDMDRCGNMQNDGKGGGVYE